MTLFSTVIIAIFTINISTGNLEIVKNSQTLTYETEVDSVKNKKIKYYEDTTGNQKIIIPMRVENIIKSGKIKVIYVVTEDITEDTGFRFIKLNADAENGFDYIMKGTVDSLKKSSINFFVYYIDMSNNISYDYVVIFPEFNEIVNHIEMQDQYGNEIKQEDRKKIIGKDSSMKIFNQYDLITSTIYKEELEKLNEDLNLQVNSYEKVIQMSQKIKEVFVNKLLAK